ncbi:hypothetical protein TCSYLVIO_000071 [Trypanosoma cruzi]|nr:hypothetical protein TCSYLVIO_000071 [Trypanosoma cruzi]
MAAIHAVRSNINNHARRKKFTQKQKDEKNTAAGCGCVWRCGCLPALAEKKNKTRGKKCVLRPTGPRRTPTRHGSLSAPFVAALLMRAAGEAHRAVVVSVSVGVRVEQLGGKHTAPLTGRVRQQTIKEGRVEKKKVHSDCPQKQRKKGRE